MSSNMTSFAAVLYIIASFWTNTVRGNPVPIIKNGETRPALTKPQFKQLKQLVKDYFTPEICANATRDEHWAKVVDEFTKSLVMPKKETDIDLEDDWVILGQKISFTDFVDANNKQTKISSKSWPNLSEKDFLRLQGLVQEQLLKTLAESARQLCFKETCGKNFCSQLIEFKSHKESNGNYIFTSLWCGENPLDAIFKEPPNKITLEVLKPAEPDQNITTFETQTPMPGYYTNLTSWIPSWNSTSRYCGGVFKNTACAVYDDVVNQPLANAFDPTRVVKTVVQSLLAAAVIDGYQTVRGTTQQQDWNLIPGLAEEHLERGKHVFTSTQQGRVRSWIDEAKKRLKSYAIKKTEEAQKLSDATTNTAISLQKLMDQTKEAAQAGIVSEDMLREKEDLELLNLLSALQDFLLIPSEIAQSTREEIDQRISESPAKGSDEFKKSLKERAHMLAANGSKSAVAQNKKVIVSASGPGTGKTTGFERMALWAGVPICKLTGEEVNNWNLADVKKNVMDLISDWVADCIKHKFRVNGKGVVNGLVLFDDFHYVFGYAGALDEYKRDLRTKFFSKFVKNGGDPSIESVVSADFSRGKEWPKGIEKELDMNTSRIQFLLTLNEVPKELTPSTADQPTLDRTVRIDATYLTATERMAFAQGTLLEPGGLVEEIEKIVGAAEIKKLDVELCKSTLGEVANADIKIAFGSHFNGKFGFRGLIELLEQYKAHVLGKATYPLDPKICSFEGKVNFDVAKAIGSIESYRGKINEKMKEEEVNAKLAIEAQKLRTDAEWLTFSVFQKEIFDKLLANIEDKNLSEDIRRKSSQNADRIIQLYKNVVEIPNARDMGTALESEFGYLQSKDGHEIDRFRPLILIIRDIHQRLNNQRKGKFVNPNRLIRINFIDDEAQDSLLFEKIGRSLGGIPVINIEHGKHLVVLASSPDKWKLKLDAAQIEKLDSLEDRRIRVKNFVHGKKAHDTYAFDLKFIKGESSYFGLSSSDLDDRAFFMLPNDRLPEFLNSLDTGNNSPEHSWFDLMPNPYKFSTGDLEKALKDYFTPKIQMPLWDSLLTHATTTKSTTESLITITLNRDVVQAIVKWHSKKRMLAQHSLQLKSEAIAAFQSYLQERINHEKGITLTDGTTIDGRKLTIVLISSGSEMKEIMFNSGFEQKLDSKARPFDLVLGAPPIDGRGTQARAILNKELREILEQLNENSEEVHTIIELTSQEEETFIQLVAYDKAMALEAREYGLPTSFRALEQAVGTITAIVKERVDNYFSFKYTIQSMDGLKASWHELYQHQKDKINEIQAKAEEAENRKQRELLFHMHTPNYNTEVNYF